MRRGFEKYSKNEDSWAFFKLERFVAFAFVEQFGSKKERNSTRVIESGCNAMHLCDC